MATPIIYYKWDLFKCFHATMRPIDKEGEELFNVIGFGPKIGTAGGVIALNLPFGFALRDGIDVSKTWEFHPTLLFTPLGGNQLGAATLHG